MVMHANALACLFGGKYLQYGRTNLAVICLPLSLCLYLSGASILINVHVCVHACNYVTYHQGESSEYHDQQNDHWSYQHLGGCRE